MSATSTLLTIAAIHFAAMASPGPNVLLVTQTAMAHSRRRALAVAAGVATGALLLAGGAALGLGLLIGQAGWLRTAVQVAGGAYLIFIGIQTWRGAGDPPPTPSTSPDDGRLGRDYRRGLFTNLTNPKAAVFFGSILAPALDADVSDAVRVAAVALIAVNALWWHGLLAVLFSLPGVQRGYGRVKPAVDRVVGGLLALLGGRLALGAALESRLS